MNWDCGMTYSRDVEREALPHASVLPQILLLLFPFPLPPFASRFIHLKLTLGAFSEQHPGVPPTESGDRSILGICREGAGAVASVALTGFRSGRGAASGLPSPMENPHLRQPHI